MEIQADPARACAPVAAREETMLKTLKLTPTLLAHLARVADAEATYPNETAGYLPVEIEKVALADAVLTAIAEQVARLERLPATAPVVPVVVTSKRERGRG
jgi:hypothetical protein